ncbi:mannose-1-phosphate guanylyltransferase/mannose-6-phosphate isomerase [Granulibacter bethesdensis]|uniref:mannose-1-phosphate guanylyltransferase/mannose-6-phosphate isomerase n=1 Tax=Granulibacter bethesdensis TaxID=364410 RepID=UPI00090C43CE|nr:mannose-1-phosphate guanylyltransferase/mannose-6-phosphate isomerase [Granulibacter bethesdensis]APH58664.1 Mannose-1-phosphate guanylyltransferase [Granulibacter bethesdensis]
MVPMDQTESGPDSPKAPFQPLSPQEAIIPVILSGGTGTRLWPVSRESFPKQYWNLTGENSLIQDTMHRAQGPQFAPPILVCNQDHRFLIAEQARSAGVENVRIVLEPCGRNSAPAILAAALLAAETNPDSVLWMLAADHSVTQPDALVAALGKAVAAAKAGYFVTFGMQPTAPETGYGYIEVGDSITELSGVHRLRRFLEKPDTTTAQALVSSGQHLWNSGMFVFTARTLIEEMRQHAPVVLEAVTAAVAGRTQDLDFLRLAREPFVTCPDISLDYAVAEKTSRAAVVPADIGWSDVGSWSALWELGDKDDHGNVVQGDAMLESASNCYVRSDGIVTAVIGLKDAVIVTTKDAVLAMHRDHAQDVKKIVDRLKRSGKPEAASHNRIYRPWGFYESLIQSDRFQVKRIVVSPGHRLSLQKHYHRAEHWVVVAGTAIVTRDEEDILVRENESIYLPLGTVHRLSNPGHIPLALIEVQSGAYLGEDDIVRLEDTYGRQ